MAEELRVPESTLAAIRDGLRAGRGALEDAGASAPRTVDAGDASALLTGMLSRVLAGAAAMSGGLAGVSSRVAEAAAGFRETDAEVAATYDRAGVPRVR